MLASLFFSRVRACFLDIVSTTIDLVRINEMLLPVATIST
jgi:hypothetical protein